MLKASANTENSIGIDSSSSIDNVKDLLISQSLSNHLMNPASSIDPFLSIINQANKLDEDSDMIQDDFDYPFNAPTYPNLYDPR